MNEWKLNNDFSCIFWWEFWSSRELQKLIFVYFTDQKKPQLKLLTGSNVSVMKIEFKDRKQNCICCINNWKVDRSLVSIFFVAKARVRRVKNKFLSSTFEKVLCILTSFLLLYVNWTPNIAAMVLHRDQWRCYLGYRKCKEFRTNPGQITNLKASLKN